MQAGFQLAEHCQASPHRLIAAVHGFDRRKREKNSSFKVGFHDRSKAVALRPDYRYDAVAYQAHPAPYLPPPAPQTLLLQAGGGAVSLALPRAQPALALPALMLPARFA